MGVSATKAAIYHQFVDVSAAIAGATPKITPNTSLAERVARRVVFIFVVTKEMERVSNLLIELTIVVSVVVEKACTEVVVERSPGARLRLGLAENAGKGDRSDARCCCSRCSGRCSSRSRQALRKRDCRTPRWSCRINGA